MLKCFFNVVIVVLKYLPVYLKDDLPKGPHVLFITKPGIDSFSHLNFSI